MPRRYAGQELLSGTLPTEISHLTRLNTLSAHTRHISHCVADAAPHVAGGEPFAGTRRDIYANAISGTVPGGIGESTLQTMCAHAHPPGAAR